jgi:hypothetical protein
MKSCLRQELFVNKEAGLDSLTCYLGKGILNKPMVTECGHTFCAKCLEDWFTKSNNCPFCGTDLTNSKDYCSVNVTISAIIDKLEVFCQNKQYLSDNEDTNSQDICLWQGKYGDLKKHLDIECDFSEKQCANGNCSFKGIKKVLTQHLPNCMYRNITCGSCGKADIFYIDKQKHDEVCEEKNIACLLDCGLEIKRKDYPLHRRRDCPNNYTNLYVRGFSTSTTEKDLHDLFQKYGEIVMCIPVYQKEKQPFGFVCFRTPEAAHAAETDLKDTEQKKKKKLFVSKAETPRQVWKVCRTRYPDSCIYLRNIPEEVTEADLAKAFSEVGFVLAAHIVVYKVQSETNGFKEIRKGTAYVCFSLPAESEAAVNYCLTHTILNATITASKYLPEEAKQQSQYMPKQYQPYQQIPMQYPYPQQYPSNYMPTPDVNT